MVANGDQYTSGFADAANNTSNGTATNILDAKIPGSHFHDALSTASMVVAGLCFLFFFGICILHCLSGWGKVTNQKKRFGFFIGLSKFVLMLYFAIYTADRILTEIGEKRVIMYYPFLIVLTTMTLFGDSLLALFLLRPFTTALFELVHDNEKNRTFLLTLFLRLIAWGLNLLAVANPAAFIYYLVSNRLLTDETKNAIKQTGGPRIMVLTAYREITLAFYCIYLGAVLIMTWIAVSSLKKLKQRRTPRKALTIGLPVLVACLDVRGLVTLVYASLFQYTVRGQSPVAKFFHVLLYGFLSVAIYAVVVWITRSKEWEEESDVVVYKVEQGPGVVEQYPGQVYKGEGVAVGAHQMPQYTPQYGH